MISATRALVLRDGVDAFTPERVARELGVTKQAIYYYFDSKEALLLALCFEEWVAVATAVHEATQRASLPADALEALIRGYFGHYCGRLDVFVLVTQTVQASKLASDIDPKLLAPTRPVNDLMYGATEARIAAEQAQGGCPTQCTRGGSRSQRTSLRRACCR